MREAAIQVRQVLANETVLEPHGVSSAGLQLVAEISKLSGMVHDSFEEMQRCVTYSERDGIPALSVDPLRQSGVQQEVAWLQLAVSVNLAQQTRFIAQMRVLSRLVCNTVMALSNCYLERANELTKRPPATNGSPASHPINGALADGTSDDYSIESEFVLSLDSRAASASRTSSAGGAPAAASGEGEVRHKAALGEVRATVEVSTSEEHVHEAAGGMKKGERPRHPRNAPAFPLETHHEVEPSNVESTDADEAVSEEPLRQKSAPDLEEKLEPGSRERGDVGGDVYVGKGRHVEKQSEGPQHRGADKASMQEDGETKRYAWREREEGKERERERERELGKGEPETDSGGEWGRASFKKELHVIVSRNFRCSHVAHTH